MNNIKQKDVQFGPGFICSYYDSNTHESVSVALDHFYLENIVRDVVYKMLREASFDSCGYAHDTKKILYTDIDNQICVGTMADLMMDVWSSDSELIEKNPSMKEAWVSVLNSIKEYELVKKLVKDGNDY